jgi:uncharacterized membrane protein affecting hemolysin expression
MDARISLLLLAVVAVVILSVFLQGKRNKRCAPTTHTHKKKNDFSFSSTSLSRASNRHKK